MSPLRSLLGWTLALAALGPAAAATVSGSVPDGGIRPGTPLNVSLDAGGDLSLTWGGSCVPDDVDYAVDEGILGNFTSHVPRSCSTAGATTLSLAPGPASHYYLVVPRKASVEGSYGLDGDISERPASLSACAVQSLASCPGDPDSDGIADPLDNCRTAHNVTQSDCDDDDAGDACDNDFAAGFPCPDPANDDDYVFWADPGRPPLDFCHGFVVENTNLDYEYKVDWTLSAVEADCVDCLHNCSSCPNPPNPRGALIAAPQVFDFNRFLFNPFNHCCDLTGNVLYCAKLTLTQYRYRGDADFHDFVEDQPVLGFAVVGAVKIGTKCLGGSFEVPSDGGGDDCPMHYDTDTGTPNCADGDMLGDPCDDDDDDDGCRDNWEPICTFGICSPECPGPGCPLTCDSRTECSTCLR